MTEHRPRATVSALLVAVAAFFVTAVVTHDRLDDRRRGSRLAHLRHARVRGNGRRPGRPDPDRWAIKVGYEAPATPVTYAIVDYLKRREGLDVFGRRLDPNPLPIGRNR